MTTRQYLAACFLFAIFTCVPLTGLAQGKGETVKFQDYPGSGNMLIRIAASKGYCEKFGIKCQLQMIPSGALGAQALLAKSIDVGFFPPETQILAINKGANLKAIFSGATQNIFLIAIRQDLEAPNADKGFPAFMADLKGKKIGVTARGAASEITFSFLLQKAGLKAEDVNYFAVGAPNTAYSALISKQIDAIINFEPSGVLCELLRTCKVIWRGSTSPQPPETYAANGASSNNVARQEYLDQNPHVAQAIIKAVLEAEAFIQNPANFDEAVKIALSYFKFDLPNSEALMIATMKQAVPAYKASISRQALKAIAEHLYQTRQIEAPFDTRLLVYEKAP
ncbi:MAG: ABC transporter substrate-binding protein [Burkholderiaceae bacterium]|nr:ABC transporter substrate-binding protein [Burkholderiaceae bacterium]